MLTAFNKLIAGAIIALLALKLTPLAAPPGPPDAPIIQKEIVAEIIYESSTLSKLPAGQIVIMGSQTITDYLNTHAKKDEAGNKMWRNWDKDVKPPDDIAKPLTDAFAKAETTPGFSVPWLIVTNGKTGYNQKLPANVDSTLATLKKYGGQ